MMKSSSTMFMSVPVPLRVLVPVLMLVVSGSLLTGCSDRDADDRALAEVPVMRVQPALVRALRHDRAAIVESLERTQRWFDSSRSRQSYPWSSPAISHDRARRSVKRMLTLVQEEPDPRMAAFRIVTEFQAYEATGAAQDHTVLFTAYYAPEYRASRTPSPAYPYPIYATPPALRNDRNLQWRTRTEIEDGALLQGTEIAWLTDTMDVYLLHVNGSARLRLPDGSAMHVGVSVTNNLPYTSLGRLLIDANLAPSQGMSMQTIRALHRRFPTEVEQLMRPNDRYVFFHEIPAERWPRSAIGVPLTGHASIAADRSLFPPAMPVLVSTNARVPAIGARYDRLMVDQDTGGAIKTPGRADLFFGVGDKAGEAAGRFMAEGRMWYFVIRSDAARAEPG